MMDQFDISHFPTPAGGRASGGNGASVEPMESLRVLAETLSRAQLASRAGLTFGGQRDMYEALGYKRELLPKDYRDRYKRGGVAKRIVEAYPKATWRAGVEMLEDDDPEIETAFERQWLELDKRLSIWATFLRADILAGLGPYSIILLGLEGELEEPVVRSTPEGLLFLAPYGSDEAKIDTVIGDTANERFGLPEFYKVSRAIDTASGKQNFERRVHWSRVIHIVDGQLDDRVNGTPRLEAVWNHLDELDKITGGGSEAFWLRVHQGFQLNIDPQVKMSQPQIDELKVAAEEFAHQMRRIIAMKGAELEAMGSDVANFDKQVTSIISLVSGATGIPQRILLGSERGELASTQDKENWDERVQDRRGEFAEPVIEQLLERFMGWGVLPETPDAHVRWPEIEELNEKERAEVATLWAGLNKKISGPVVMPSEVRDRVLGLDELSEEELAEWEEQHQAPNIDPDDGQGGNSAPGDGGESGNSPPSDGSPPPPQE